VRVIDACNARNASASDSLDAVGSSGAKGGRAQEWKSCASSCLAPVHGPAALTRSRSVEETAEWQRAVAADR